MTARNTNLKMSWQDICEIVAGGLLNGDISADAINPSDMIEPYPGMVVTLRDAKKKTVDYDKLVLSVGIDAITAAQAARDRVKRIPANWVEILGTTAVRHRESRNFDQFSKALASGKDIDISQILGSLHRIDSGSKQFTNLNSIKPEENCYKLTGFEPFDVCIGGLPKAGLTTLGAPPSCGKTSLAIQLMASEVRQNNTNKAYMFSVEMTMQQVAKRCLEIAQLNKAQRERVFLCDEVVSPAEVSSIAASAKADGATLICVDFAELLLENESSESAMFNVYLTLARAAKKLEIPILLLSQLNRNYSYNGGIPKATDLRYSGIGEALSAMVLLLYNPNQLFSQTNTRNQESSSLPVEHGKGYIIAGKVRYGTRKGGIGAIQLPWDGSTAWGERPWHWFPLS